MAYPGRQAIEAKQAVQYTLLQQVTSLANVIARQRAQVERLRASNRAEAYRIAESTLATLERTAEALQRCGVLDRRLGGDNVFNGLPLAGWLRTEEDSWRSIAAGPPTLIGWYELR